MKQLNNFLVLSDGSLVFIKRPNFKSVLNTSIIKIDLNNHFVWFKSDYITQTEASTFVYKFNKNAIKTYST